MITTMKGDRGETSLYDGTRVSKDDARVELNGEIDKLTALLGLCKVRSGSTDRFEKVQRDLMTVMAIVANGYGLMAGAGRKSNPLDQLETAITNMEDFIREATEGKRFEFVLPGKNEAEATIHLTRTQARACERRLVTLARLNAEPTQNQCYEILMRYLNRLSDYLFCLALG